MLVQTANIHSSSCHIFLSQAETAHCFLPINRLIRLFFSGSIIYYIETAIKRVTAFFVAKNMWGIILVASGDLKSLVCLIAFPCLYIFYFFLDTILMLLLHHCSVFTKLGIENSIKRARNERDIIKI